MKKIIIFDLDNTIYSLNKKVLPQTLKLLENFLHLMFLSRNEDLSLK